LPNKFLFFWVFVFPLLALSLGGRYSLLVIKKLRGHGEEAKNEWGGKVISSIVAFVKKTAWRESEESKLEKGKFFCSE